MESRRGPGILITLLLVGGILGAVVWFISRPEGDVRPAAPTLTAQDRLALIHQKNVGLAALENAELDEAVRIFDDIAEAVPEERLPHRNLLVAHVSTLQDTADAPGDVTFAAAADAAEAALSAAQEGEPDSAPVHILASRLAQKHKQLQRAIDELRRATQIAPDDPAIWYELHETGKYAADANLQAQTDDALGRAFQLAPDNLIVLLERLQVQAEQQDAAIKDTLQAGAPRWRQLQPGIQRRVGVDIAELVDAAVSAVDEENWPLVRRNCMLLRNLLMPEEATRSDRRRIERHPLEFVLEEFSPEFMAGLSDASAADTEVPVQFASFGEVWQLPVSGRVEAVMIADFDLDRSADRGVLRGGIFQVFTRAPEGWSSLIRHNIDEQLTGIVAADLDNDFDDAPPSAITDPEVHPTCHRADLDVVLYGSAGVRAFENRLTIDNGTASETRRLVEIELPEPLRQTRDVGDVMAADLDVDGDLDLLVLAGGTVTVWSNLGNFSFSDELQVTGLPAEADLTAMQPIDLDGDLDPDLVVAGADGAVGLLENLRHGEFQWRPLSQKSNGAPIRQIEPIDSSGSWNLVLGGEGGVEILATRTLRTGKVEVGERVQVAEHPCSGLISQDWNNDGLRDLIGWTADGLTVYAGRADGSLTVVDGIFGALPLPPAIAEVRSADIDDDGRPDLLVSGSDGVGLLHNTGGEGQSWLNVSLMAAQIKGAAASASGRVNHYGIGSVLELRDGLRRQRLIVRGPVTHFGLGETQQPDALRVLWTNGVPANIIHPPPRTFVCEKQTLKGSCPYLYGWDGERFTFITDLLWAAPIGLVGPDGRRVPDRPWEHLKISRHQLQPRDGRYELRLTEELWEAAYFDCVELFAVDHPAGVEVFTNEKVGPPAVAEHRLHTVRRRRNPVSAVDQAGRDVLPLVRETDDRYVRLFDYKLCQGYTEETWLELDLGECDDAEQITLFLTGWIYPTDTTINVALSQNPDLAGPQPPSLWMPDAEGQWQQVLPFMGFPGGKTKTIAVDLSGLFPTDDYRLRIVTSCELYWDAVFFTVNEPPVELRETRLPLLRAELRPRGVSRPIVHPGYGPERYDYEHVQPSPWLPMRGRFTRFGDVHELLAVEDDHLVVMGSGDEVVLEFAAPDEPPPDRWTRDFVLRSVGWDKDADLHTVYGQTVEPMPLRAMVRYPPTPHESRLNDPAYKRYLDTYQTREMPLR